MRAPAPHLQGGGPTQMDLRQRQAGQPRESTFCCTYLYIQQAHTNRFYGTARGAISTKVLVPWITADDLFHPTSFARPSGLGVPCTSNAALFPLVRRNPTFTPRCPRLASPELPGLALAPRRPRMPLADVRRLSSVIARRCADNQTAAALQPTDDRGQGVSSWPEQTRSQRACL
jgi:hypothetical protein